MYKFLKLDNTVTIFSVVPIGNMVFSIRNQDVNNLLIVTFTPKCLSLTTFKNYLNILFKKKNICCNLITKKILDDQVIIEGLMVSIKATGEQIIIKPKLVFNRIETYGQVNNLSVEIDFDEIQSKVINLINRF